MKTAYEILLDVLLKKPNIPIIPMWLFITVIVLEVIVGVGAIAMMIYILVMRLY